MLRSSKFQRNVIQPFICRKCSAKLHSASIKKPQLKSARNDGPLSRLQDHRTNEHSLAKIRFTSPHFAQIRYASTEILSDENPSHDLPPPERILPIRQRLRQWELENALVFDVPPQLGENVGQGNLLNSITRTDDGQYPIELDINENDDDAPVMAYDGDELLYVGDRRGFLLAGDLVELRTIIGQELAIFVRELETQSQFYTMSGKWIHRSSQSAHFFVPHFVDPADLHEILPHLPTSDVSRGLRDRLQAFPSTVPRDLGKPLISKMVDFWAKSDATYQAASTKLDNFHKYFSAPKTYGYATLEQIAEKVLPAATLRGGDAKFPSHALYAVHRSLFRDDIGVRPQIRGTLRAGGQYEISPWAEITNAKLACTEVRLHREQQAGLASGAKHLPQSGLEKFAIAARYLIDHNRKKRSFTLHGTLGPLQNSQKSTDTVLIDHRNSIMRNSKSGHFVEFLLSWAGKSSFGRQSSLNGIGSEILRCIDRYEDIDLNQSTAWTFLQEIGAIDPWENRLIYDLRLDRKPMTSISTHSRSISLLDRLQSLRKDWGDLPVYCIDDPGAHEIDDGISIEATSVAGEFWVHIHTADPASHVRPDSANAARAEAAAENIYLPERVYSMLPVESVSSKFSLASNKPSLTFSARMNKEGYVLDAKITPGTIHQVLFFSPAVLKEILLGPTSPEREENVSAVGQVNPENSTSRPMFQTHELSDTHKGDLHLLHEIGEGHATLLRAKGGVDQNFQSKLKTSVSMPAGARGGNYSGDPTIQLSGLGAKSGPHITPPTQGNLVQTFMLVAAQVAARWCSDRGIPVPFRVTPRNPAKEDPSEFFLRKVLPSRAESGVASNDITFEYLRLIGGVLPSTTPGPHAAVGVDMMVRCTSPLRRFTDLLVHWQIGAALLEEDRLGQSLIGNTKDDFLPFSKARVDALLPHLDTREKVIKYGQNETDRHWLCYFLLRAWQFKEAKISSTFPFLIRNIDVAERKAFGTLVDFSARAQCSIPDKMNLQEIRAGDMFEVELEDINVYSRQIQVKAFRQLDVKKKV